MGSDTRNPYRLIRLMARGVSGDVHRGRRVADEKIVAVKVLHRDADENPDFTQAMIQSAFQAKELKHPAAVKVQECITSSGKILLASELVEGEVLARVLQRNTRFPARTVTAVVGKTAEFLSAAAKMGLHHGRLSPAKMFVASSGKLRILGTGLYARRPAVPAAHPTGYTWPPHYVAPEVLEGLPSSEASDVYSLGVVAYHLLTGSSPFVCERLSSLKVEKMSPVEWAEAVARGANADLLILIERMTSPYPQKRPTWPQVLEETSALQHPAKLRRPAPRIKQPVPEEKAFTVDADEPAASAKESPFLLPVLVSLLFLVAATGVILKTALERSPAESTGAVATPDAGAPDNGRDAEPTPATPARPRQPEPPETGAAEPAEPEPGPAEIAESLLQTVAEMEKRRNISPANLAAEYERIAAEYNGTPAAILARASAKRLRTAIEQAGVKHLGDLRKRVDAALARSSPREALEHCDVLLRRNQYVEEVQKEKDRIAAVLPRLYSELQTSAELYAAQGNYQAAIQLYGRVIEGFPPGEWHANAEYAIRRLEELDERRNEAEEARSRQKAREDERAAFDDAVKRAYDSAAAFSYSKARLALERTHVALKDVSLKRALLLYLDALRYEEDLFEAAADRLPERDPPILLTLPSEDEIEEWPRVTKINERGVELRTGTSHMLYPWSRVSEYQQVHLLRKCMDEGSPAEWLGLASSAFHRGLFGEAQNHLSIVLRLDDGRMADTAAGLQALFDELAAQFRRPRARSR